MCDVILRKFKNTSAQAESPPCSVCYLGTSDYTISIFHHKVFVSFTCFGHGFDDVYLTFYWKRNHSLCAINFEQSALGSVWAFLRPQRN